MTFLEERHRVIANNIANVNTPFYKAKTAPLSEFRDALAEAVAVSKRRGGTPLGLRDTRHVDFAVNGMTVTPLEAAGNDVSVLRHDGNNVNLEREMADLADNTLLYRVMGDLLRRQFMMLSSAIKERVE